MIAITREKTLKGLVLFFFMSQIIYADCDIVSQPTKLADNQKILHYFQFTPLHEAAYENNLERCKELLDAGEDIEAQDFANHTPLHLAAKMGNLKIILLLVSRGANIEAKSDYNMTALHHAAERNHRFAVELLLLLGADEKAETNTCRNAAELASIQKHLCTEAFLRSEWPKKSIEIKTKRLKKLGKKLNQPFGQLPYLFEYQGPCDVITQFLSVQDTYKFLDTL